MTNNDPVCPLCQRTMPEGSSNEHHLVPVAFGGKETVTLHRICHDKIHHTFSERELQKHYHTIDRLLSHREIRKFVKWVRKQDPMFYSKSKDTKNRNKKRR